MLAESLVTLASLADADVALVDAARGGREHAHAPYSRFAVGAAVRTASGTVFAAGNIENASYGLSMCAERVALFKARSAGADPIVDIALVGDLSGPLSPCGACRQVMAELAPTARVLMVNLEGSVRLSDVASLLPWSFEASALPGAKT